MGSITWDNKIDVQWLLKPYYLCEEILGSMMFLVSWQFKFFSWHFLLLWVDELLSNYMHWTPSVSPSGVMKYWFNRITPQWSQYILGTKGHMCNCKYLETDSGQGKFFSQSGHFVENLSSNKKAWNKDLK